MPKLWRVEFAVVLWGCLVDITRALVIAKEDPRKAYHNFVDQELARSYLKKWKKKEWQAGGCNVQALPAATMTLVNSTCGNHAESWERCVCILAKAHSCHIGCEEETKAKEPCPRECSARICKDGNPSNGGVKLSGGIHDGKCYKHCSKKYGPVRYCGLGYWYDTGDYLDCTGCDPMKPKPVVLKVESKKTRWTRCMANCYPNPTCQEMCAAGSDGCYAECTEKYTSSVEPFWDLFKHSDTHVLDYIPT